MIKTARLPRNFHKTFKPERQYINALLRYAAGGKSGNYQEIADHTGIPMGSSSGKVPAIIDYCRGMGLITLSETKPTSVKTPVLSPFGRIVLREDPFLKEDITQWLAHFNMCSPLIGAEVWYQTFFPGKNVLGMNFQRMQLETFLQKELNVRSKGITGPLLGTYEDEAAFKTCGVLEEEGSLINRKPAPASDEFAIGYGAWLLQLIHDHFPKGGQIPVVELDYAAGCITIPGWEIASWHKVLQMVENKGIISVDRHMDPWLLHPRVELDVAWETIFDDLI